MRFFMGIVLALHTVRFRLNVNRLAVLSSNSAESPAPAALIVQSASLIFPFIAISFISHRFLCEIL
jgi:hypothetical protein